MNKFIQIEKNSLVYYASENLGMKHGFSTRLGGISTEPHLESLNLGFNRGDSYENVMKNFSIFSSALDISSNSLVSADQIHSNIVKYITPKDCGMNIDECDAFVTDCTNVALCIKTADCVPILFSDCINNVIGAAHAGWRGTINNIAINCVSEMCNHGANINNINVAIGPSISKCCYEVSEDFFQIVLHTLGADICNKFVIQSDSKQNKYYADIKAINEYLLIRGGISSENISISTKCTCCEPNLFFSHRASKGIRGTMCSIISL